jgi:hypothetical protein
MKKGLTTIGIIAGLVILVIGSYFVSYRWLFPYLHNQTLKQFSEPLIGITPSPGIQKIDSISEVGQQSGNSDHCDYLAAQLLKTDLPKSEIEKYYRSNYKGKTELNFFWTDEPHKPGIGAVNPTNISTLDEWVNTKSKMTGANLIIYIFEEGLTSAFDYRCS